MDIKIRNKFIEIKNGISDWFIIFVTNNRHVQLSLDSDADTYADCFAYLLQRDHVQFILGIWITLCLSRVSIEGVKKLCIDFSNNQKLRYVK